MGWEWEGLGEQELNGIGRCLYSWRSEGGRG
jgi:hypothetical protein